MSTALRPQQLIAQVERYVHDASGIAARCLSSAKTMTAFREIYAVSLSADVVLRNLSSSVLRPRLVAARSIILRLPMLVGLGQAAVAAAEMRRLVELTLWTVYFTDHPVEWCNFGEGGFSRDARKPISYAAHRELTHYFEYARELMDTEPSGLGAGAVDSMKQLTQKLNSRVHAGELALSVRRIPPYERVSETALRRFGRLQRHVFANCCLLLAAYRRHRFDRFNATARSHFDWLIGPTLRRAVRRGEFGLG